MKLQDFIKLLADYAEANLAIRRFHFDFSDNLGQISSENDQFPLLYVEVTSSNNLDNATTGYKGSEFGFNIFVVDVINRSRSNILSILNDTELIMQDIKGYIESINSLQLQDGSIFIEPLNNAYYDNLAGMSMRLSVQVEGSDYCPIEYKTCTPITLQFMNTIGDLITRRNLCVNDDDTEVVIVPNGEVNVFLNGDFKELIDIPSGASITYDIEVNDGEVILYNSLGEELSRSNVGADEVKNLIVPDASVNLNVNDTLWVTLSVPSDGTLDVTIPQSDWTESDIDSPSYIKNKPSIPTPIDEFTDLIDTPNDYINQAGKIVAVKNDETGLEFISAGGGGITQVQSDWNQSDSNEVDYIKNKPDLSVYATVNYVDGEISGLNIPSSTSDLVNDSGFITTSSLTGYATESYVNNAIGGLNIPSNTSDLVNDSGFITTSSLSGYATEIYVDNAINGLNIPSSTNDLVNDSGFITLSALTGYATESWVNTQIGLIAVPTKTSDLTNDSGFITTSSLSGYATEVYVNNAISGLNIPTKTSDLTNDSGFITSSALTGYATEIYVNNAISALNIPSSTSDLVNDSGFITTSSLTGYATQTWVSNTALNGYATQTWVTSQIGSITVPTKTSDLTNDSGFITTSSLSGYATELYVDNEISALNIPINTSDLTNDSGFITSSALSPYSTTTQMNTAISNKVDKEDVFNSPYNLTLSTAHFGKFIIMYDMSDNNITIPTHADEPFPIGTRFDGFGMWDINIIASPGVYIASDEDKTIVSEKTGFSLIKNDNNGWLLVGKLK